MALVWTTTYSGKVATDAAYPQGKARNVTTSGDGTGTPWDEDLINDWAGFFQKLLYEAGTTPSGNPDTVVASDYYDSLISIFSGYSAPAASDTVAGISEYATVAETITGTATNRTVTPAGLQGKVATDATVITGTSTTTLVTPAGLQAKTASNAETVTGTATNLLVTPAGLQNKLNSLATAWQTPSFINGWASSFLPAFRWRTNNEGKILQICGSILPSSATSVNVCNIGAGLMSGSNHTYVIGFGRNSNSDNRISIAYNNSTGNLYVEYYSTGDSFYYFNVSLILDTP